MDEDDVLLTKFIMAGGYLWNPLHHPAQWFAIEPGCCEHDACHNCGADTPQAAVRRFIQRYGAPWDEKYVSFASTISAGGPTTNPTATSK